MITLSDVQSRLQTIDKDFTVVEHPTNEMAGVYYKNRFCGTSLPKEGIYEERNAGYGVEIGSSFRAHNGWSDIRQRAETFLKQMASETKDSQGMTYKDLFFLED